MRGYACKCDHCAAVEFVTEELWDKQLLPKGWMHLFSYESKGEKDFCSEECVRQHFKLMREVKA